MSVGKIKNSSPPLATSPTSKRTNKIKETYNNERAFKRLTTQMNYEK